MTSLFSLDFQLDFYWDLYFYLVYYHNTLVVSINMVCKLERMNLIWYKVSSRDDYSGNPHVNAYLLFGKNNQESDLEWT